MQRVLVMLPVAVVIVIGGFFLWGLNPDRDPNAIPSALVSHPAPAFELEAVDGVDVPGLKTADLAAAGEPVLVNVFASWCVPCRAEHKVLTRLAASEGFPLFGINYKDKPEAARDWLNELGNPYQRIGSDLSGRAGIEWGISGVPESFLVNAEGTVVWRYVGPIASAQAQDELRDALAAARAAGAGS
ncbi:DsbE family thiol:disulfide interchange protein [Marinovum sp. 2_MG-2023]|uniref:DsbE family thiol:disulfide interchange protein n=1 Tax=unclassified Marinovum TaxID=2647166 RepID=UPI0026E47DBE|nr:MULTISPECIES: DsbE family thiol:disulfide interchange protein [unclassified Marinovum]MDO6729374.1 DsbE family thiol:disulfide interchange protein [Marinovum sp. 2_MG-2023]MDO6780410.1 DsbE family thiol:disulfide interchange protein [Marinovum sp. 1_MG-2023]